MDEFIAKIRGQIFRFVCRLLRPNIKIESGLKIYKKFRIEGAGRICIGRNFTVGGIIGDSSQYVTIDTHSPDAVINIGDNVSLFAVRISSKYQIVIGNNVLIEETGIVDTDFHSIDKARGTPINENKERCQIHIGSNVCIGAKSVVIKGVSIGDNVVVLPGSVVSMSVKPGSCVSGNPAKQWVSSSLNSN